MSKPESDPEQPAHETPSTEEPVVDGTEQIELLFRDLRSSREGLSTTEAQRRLLVYGPNRLERRADRRWARELIGQFIHPLALLLWVAALLAALAGITAVAIAIVVVILVNALFAFVQEQQAERAVEALQAYLPAETTVLRDGEVQRIPVMELVPGDVLIIQEGDQISGDARLISGFVEIDASALTGESAPVLRSADLVDSGVPLIEARELVFSGTECTEGEANALVVATGMHTELGRIAALSQRGPKESGPLETQVRRVAWLIAAIAVGLALVFLPLATLGAGLPLKDAVVFAVGLIAGNVPEGLLPVITLALAVAVRGLAKEGAVVKRLSAAETLGSTSVICTDKTGTLTQNRMSVVHVWTPTGEFQPDLSLDEMGAGGLRLAETLERCNNASIGGNGGDIGDATEIALLDAARGLVAPPDETTRARARLSHFRFDPQLKRMSTIDEIEGRRWVHTKGAPESMIDLCTSFVAPDGTAHPLTTAERARIDAAVSTYASEGLRVLAAACRPLAPADPIPDDRADAESDLWFLGLVALVDPPRPEVAGAVQRCKDAGIRILVVTGDHPLTAAAIAKQVGLGGDGLAVVTGAEMDRLSDPELDALLRAEHDVIFARSSPEAKLRIIDVLRAQDQVVAMTGDGVNDAPALREADIGIAMGKSGTDVAREAATTVLTDDNFATIVSAVEAGRRVYDNIRKFMVYIFAHTTPEVTPFLVFALARGAVPLPLTIMQLLAFDVGTETLPALALGREPAEPGIMSRPPRPRSEHIIRPPMLLRSWLFLGGIAAALQMSAYFYVLFRGGWQWGDPTDPGTPLHHLYLQATTITFLSMVAGQIGAAFAARTDRASLRSIGVFSNHLLLWGFAFEIALAAAFVCLPPFQSLLGTATPTLEQVAIIVPFPIVVWGADEIRRWLMRRRHPILDPV